MLGTTFIVGVQTLRVMRSQFSSGCCWTYWKCKWDFALTSFVSFDDELMAENIIYGRNKKGMGMLYNEWNTYYLCLCFALFFTLHKRARLGSANLPRLLAALNLFCVLKSYVTSIRGILNIYNFCCTFLLVSWSTVQDCLGICSSLAHSVALGSLQIISVTQLATSSSTSSPW